MFGTKRPTVAGLHCPCCPRFPADNPDYTDLHVIERGIGGSVHGAGCPHLDVSADPRLHDYVEESSRNWRSRPHPDPTVMQTLRRGTVRTACVVGLGILLALGLLALAAGLVR